MTYDALVLFLYISGLHNTDGDFEGEPDGVQVRLVQLHEEALQVLAQDVCLLRRARWYSLPGDASRLGFETLLNICVEVFVEMGILSSRATNLTLLCALTNLGPV